MLTAKGSTKPPQPYEPITKDVDATKMLALEQEIQKALAKGNPETFIQDPEYRKKNRNIGENNQEHGNTATSSHPLANDPNTSALDNAITNLPSNSNEQEVRRAFENAMRNVQQKRLGLANVNTSTPTLRNG